MNVSRHGGTYGQPHGGEFAKVATAWFKWQLKGDNEAGKFSREILADYLKIRYGKLRKRRFHETVCLEEKF